MIYRLKDTKKAEKLFKGRCETMVWSCLQGIMGNIYADDKENPRSAAAILGDFCFFAGQPDEKLAAYKPEEISKKFIIMVPPSEQWSKVIKMVYGEKALLITRYAFEKNTDGFDIQKLRAAAGSLPRGYSIKMIDKPLFELCGLFEWSRDLVSQYKDYETYKKLGIGAVVLNGKTPVSGASAYSRYDGGIEIEVDTKKEYRRKGLAYVCSAVLVTECLDRNLYPCWDAHNAASAALAEKLGYRRSSEYTAFEIHGY